MAISNSLFYLFAAAWDAVVTAGRTIFGMEPSQMSLLFYLYYAAAAGGLDPLIASDHTGGQEFKVKVSM